MIWSPIWPSLLWTNASRALNSRGVDEVGFVAVAKLAVLLEVGRHDMGRLARLRGLVQGGEEPAVEHAARLARQVPTGDRPAPGLRWDGHCLIRRSSG